MPSAITAGRSVASASRRELTGNGDSDDDNKDNRTRGADSFECSFAGQFVSGG